jgi:hypothetical protein
MGDILKFGRGPKSPKPEPKKDMFNPLRVILAMAFLLLIATSLLPFFLVYGILYVFLPKASKEDSMILIGIANAYLMDFLRSVETGKRVFTDVDR